DTNSRFRLKERESADEASDQTLSQRLRLWFTVVVGVFCTVDRRDMRRVPIQVGSPDTKFLAVLVDPFPQFFACKPPFARRLAVHAHEIDRQPVAVTAVRASTMIRPIRCSLQTAGQRLAVVITECARYSRCQPSVVHCAKRRIKSQLEVPIHA